MTREQFDHKFAELMYRVVNQINEDADRLIKSGAIDIKHYGNDFELPRVLLDATLTNVREAYRPLDRKGREEAANLRKF